MKTNLIMIGFKSSGKTTVGRMLAERLGVTFCDLDDTIQSLLDDTHGAGKYTVRSYFREAGSEAFRDIETEALKSHLNEDGIVLASGGGAPLRSENQEIFRELGTVCYIKEDPERIFKRFQAHGMPAYLETVPEAERFDKMKAMWVERDEVYGPLADISAVPESDDAEDVADAIYSLITMED